ncbi:MAG: sulfite exporter TauE/SafE family protein, partial [Bacteroidota bacterium]
MTTIEYLIVLLATFLISAATLLTGFGVGTVLTPTFTLFYDVKTAVFLVSIVHLGNNLLKLGLFAKHVNKEILWRFGAVSIVGAVAGSLLQGVLAGEIVRIALALFLIASGAGEFFPKHLSFRFPRHVDMFGGFFSGFMGGMIGNQGAIRSAYLLNYNLSKEAFIATATVIAIVIDLSRIPVYLLEHSGEFALVGPQLVTLTVVAFAGTLLGKRLLKSISLEKFRATVSAFILLFGFYLLFT